MGGSHKMIKVDQNCFVACAAVNWLLPFSQSELACIALASMERLRKKARSTTQGYVLMRDHIHIVGSLWPLVPGSGKSSVAGLWP
jgi:REP-associated tyrosine transposase